MNIEHPGVCRFVSREKVLAIRTSSLGAGLKQINKIILNI